MAAAEDDSTSFVPWPAMTGVSGSRARRRDRHADRAVIQQEIDPRARRECCQPFEQLHRLEEQLCRPVRPSVPQIEHHLPLGGQVQPVGRDGRTERVAAQPFEPRSIARRHDDGGVEIEAVPPGVTRSAPRRRQGEQFRRRATPTHRRTGPLPECPPSLHRRAGNASQHGRLFPPPIGGAPLSEIVRHATAGQQTMDPAIDRSE